MSYRLTEQAIASLDEILDFVARQMENPEGADVVEDYLFAAFERVGAAPGRCGGRRRPDLTDKPVKFLTVRKYVLIYDDRSSPVVILTVVGARRDMTRLLVEDPRFPPDPDDDGRTC